MDKIYYSPRGYWRGLAAVKKLAAAAKVSEQVAHEWLQRQAIWQVYLPAPKNIPRRRFDEHHPNAVHQADLLFLPYDSVGRKIYKYALTVVDVASRYKEAEPLMSKSSSEVASALARIYKRGPLTWPNLLNVDSGHELMGAVTQLLVKHNVQIRRGQPNIHRQQAIVERFNRTLSERLFGAQYAQELLIAAHGSSKRSTEWVRSLPLVVAAINDEPTRLTGKKPREAILETTVAFSPMKSHEQPLLSATTLVRYLYEPGELEGGSHRATDPNWSLTVHNIRNVVKSKPALYYLIDGPLRGFVREELLVVPADTELPPDRIIRKR